MSEEAYHEAVQALRDEGYTDDDIAALILSETLEEVWQELILS